MQHPDVAKALDAIPDDPADIVMTILLNTGVLLSCIYFLPFFKL